MSNNSRHSVKMQKKFHKEQTALREKLGKQTTAPAPEPETAGEIFDAPDPVMLEVLRRIHTA